MLTRLSVSCRVCRTGTVNSLVGAKDVTVILNGKASTLTQEQLIEMLKNTSASQVQTAEVMYNTPPEYHVRGSPSIL